VLALVNVANNRLVGPALYVPLSMAAAGLLVLLARRWVGCTWDDLGLDRERFGSGLRWGGVLLGIMVVVLAAGVALPATRGLFEDDRVRGLGGPAVLYAAFVRVTLGTVLLEEVAFRGVLPAVLATHLRRRWAIGAAAVLFGLWHILPSLGMNEVNPVADDTVGRFPQWVTVIGAVASTTAFGIWFSFLRERSGSLLAPMLAHWSSNALGYLFAYAVLTWS